MKERIDKILVDRGLVQGRDRAKAVIMEGKVSVNGVRVIKAGTMIDTDSDIDLKGSGQPYVSRGGLKLEAALDHFRIDPAGMTVMDVGSSTGGFTDCMLKRGAGRVYCIDVGYGQLAWSLRTDPRVTVIERANIRHLEKDRISDSVDIASIDLSFISLTKVLTKIKEFLRADGEIVALVKPQFEVGRADVGKGGIVRDEGKRISAVNSVRGFAEENGFIIIGEFKSPVAGQKGNIEYFLYMRRV